MMPNEWWDTRLKHGKTYDFFVENLGPADMPSRVAVRRWAKRVGVKSVLDVGCGPALDRWLDTGIPWTGTDASTLLIDKNRARGVPVTLASAFSLPFTPRSFDLVYSRHVWEHLVDFRPALEEACRVADRFVAVTFFRPPGKQARTRVEDGAYYNDYAMADVLNEFTRWWPNCAIEFERLPPQRYLPDGELIVFATRE